MNRVLIRLFSYSIAVVSVLACTQARPAGDGSDSSAASESSLLATALVPGARMPHYQAQTLDGRVVAIGAPADSVTLVNAWATWCTSCREEMGDLEQVHRAYAPRGVRVVGVSLDAGSEALVRRFVDREKLSFAIVHDREARLQTLYRIAGVPSTYVIGRDGRLIWSRTGGLHGAVDEAKRALDSAMAQ